MESTAFFNLYFPESRIHKNSLDAVICTINYYIKFLTTKHVWTMDHLIIIPNNYQKLQYEQLLSNYTEELDSKHKNHELSNEYFCEKYLCARGLLRFGENIEDEWLLVALLLHITEKCRSIIGTIEDDDGQFLLIEGAEFLPRWLKPKNCKNRVFIKSGEIHIIPLPSSPSEISLIPPKPTLRQSLTILSTGLVDTRGSDEIQNSIKTRISTYLQQTKTEVPLKYLIPSLNLPPTLYHTSLVVVPLPIAVLLKKHPSIISPIIRSFIENSSPSPSSFYNLTPLSSIGSSKRKLIHPDLSTQNSFPRVAVNIKFNRALFAHMQFIPFVADKHYTLPEKDDFIIFSHCAENDETDKKWEWRMVSLDEKNENDTFSAKIEASFKQDLVQEKKSESVKVGKEKEIVGDEIRCSLLHATQLGMKIALGVEELKRDFLNRKEDNFQADKSKNTTISEINKANNEDNANGSLSAFYKSLDDLEFFQIESGKSNKEKNTKEEEGEEDNSIEGEEETAGDLNLVRPLIYSLNAQASFPSQKSSSSLSRNNFSIFSSKEDCNDFLATKGELSNSLSSADEMKQRRLFAHSYYLLTSSETNSKTQKDKQMKESQKKLDEESESHLQKDTKTPTDSGSDTKSCDSFSNISGTDVFNPEMKMFNLMNNSEQMFIKHCLNDLSLIENDVSLKMERQQESSSSQEIQPKTDETEEPTSTKVPSTYLFNLPHPLDTSTRLLSDYCNNTSLDASLLVPDESEQWLWMDEDEWDALVAQKVGTKNASKNSEIKENKIRKSEMENISKEHNTTKQEEIYQKTAATTSQMDEGSEIIQSVKEFLDQKSSYKGVESTKRNAAGKIQTEVKQSLSSSASSTKNSKIIGIDSKLNSKKKNERVGVEPALHVVFTEKEREDVRRWLMDEGGTSGDEENMRRNSTEKKGGSKKKDSKVVGTKELEQMMMSFLHDEDGMDEWMASQKQKFTQTEEGDKGKPTKDDSFLDGENSDGEDEEENEQEKDEDEEEESDVVVDDDESESESEDEEDAQKIHQRLKKLMMMMDEELDTHKQLSNDFVMDDEDFDEDISDEEKKMNEKKVDESLNLLNNFSKSAEFQGGDSGPVTNMLGMLGIKMKPEKVLVSNDLI